jgi:ABC-type transport system involved in cytochrome bd biosynthesis fused ATPase/permease subunit
MKHLVKPLIIFFLIFTVVLIGLGLLHETPSLLFFISKLTIGVITTFFFYLFFKKRLKS